MIMGHNDDRIKKLEYGKLNPRPREKIYEDLDNKIEDALNNYEVKIKIITKLCSIIIGKSYNGIRF